MEKIYAVKKSSLEVKYNNVKFLIQDIVDSVMHNGPVTLALDCKWWAAAPVDPHVGYYTNMSQRFSKDIDEHQLLKGLFDKGLKFTQVYNISGYYLVS